MRSSTPGWESFALRGTSVVSHSAVNFLAHRGRGPLNSNGAVINERSKVLPLALLTIWALCCALLAIGVMPGNALGQDGPRSRALRIAAWNMADDTAVKALSLPDRELKIWRHTFGAELKSDTRPVFDPDILGNDIWLLQGVRRIRDIRRLFPARKWRVIVSRQILQAVLQEGENENPSNRAGAEIPVTAVAVRYRPGLKVSAQDHALGLMAEPATPLRSKEIAGTAVQISVAGRSLWVLSIDTSQSCGSAYAGCPSDAVHRLWTESKRRDGQLVVIGGRFAAHIISGSSKACPALSIEAFSGTGVLVRTKQADAVPHAQAGCIASLDMTF